MKAEPRNQHTPVDPMSLGALAGSGDFAPTTAAINTHAKAPAQQVALRGIAVDVVAPGPVWTSLHGTGGQPVERIPDFGDGAWPGGAGQPAEIAAAHVQLAGAASSPTTGATLSVTGAGPTQ